MGRSIVKLAMAAMAMALWSNQVLAADISLCDFVAKISAARKTGFAAYKGNKKVRSDPRLESVFEGTLLPPGAQFCEVVLRIGDAKIALGPNYYGCGLGASQFQSFSAADLLYDKTVAGLRACFPKASFTESKFSNPTVTKESFSWISNAQLNGYSVEVQLDNAQGFMASVSKKIPITPTSPIVAVTLIVNDEAK